MANMWILGNAYYMSENAADLYSPEIYREFYAPYTQEVINELGWAYRYYHSKGVHIHRDFAKLNG